MKDFCFFFKRGWEIVGGWGAEGVGGDFPKVLNHIVSATCSAVTWALRMWAQFWWALEQEEDEEKEEEEQKGGWEGQGLRSIQIHPHLRTAHTPKAKKPSATSSSWCLASDMLAQNWCIMPVVISAHLWTKCRAPGRKRQKQTFVDSINQKCDFLYLWWQCVFWCRFGLDFDLPSQFASQNVHFVPHQNTINSKIENPKLCELKKKRNFSSKLKSCS